MSQTGTSLLIAAGILFVITLSDPAVNTLFALLRRTAQRRIEADDFESAPQSSATYKRDVA
jgi:hypothetical protein